MENVTREKCRIIFLLSFSSFPPGCLVIILPYPYHFTLLPFKTEKTLSCNFKNYSQNTAPLEAMSDPIPKGKVGAGDPGNLG